MQCLLGPASEKPPMQQSFLARLSQQKKDKIQTKPKWKPKSALGLGKMFKGPRPTYHDDDDDDDDDDYDVYEVVMRDDDPVGNPCPGGLNLCLPGGWV